MKRKELLEIRKHKKLLNSTRGYHKYNCCRINPKNSFKHELAKFKMAYKLRKLGHTIITEGLSQNGKRIFDLLDLSTGDIFEFETGRSYKKTGKFKEVRI